MRVISGLKKGHRLKQPNTINTRPTEDRIKESIFSIIGNIEEDALALDLFAGSGAIGIEFLSRGIKKAYFVDNSKEAISTILENLEYTKLLEDAVVINSSNTSAIRKISKEKIKFNYVYIDPPFERTSLVEETLGLLFEFDIVDSKSLVIIEHKSDYSIKTNDNYMIDSIRKYGNKSITFLSCK